MGCHLAWFFSPFDDERRLVGSEWSEYGRSRTSYCFSCFLEPVIALEVPSNKRMGLTAPLGGRDDNVGVAAAASRSPFGERRRRS